MARRGMTRAQLDFLRRAFAGERAVSGKSSILVVQRGGVYARKKLAKGQRLKIIGRTSDRIHPTQQGFVVIPPSGRGELVVLDDWVQSGDFQVESVRAIVDEALETLGTRS